MTDILGMFDTTHVVTLRIYAPLISTGSSHKKRRTRQFSEVTKPLSRFERPFFGQPTFATYRLVGMVKEHDYNGRFIKKSLYESYL